MSGGAPTPTGLWPAGITGAGFPPPGRNPVGVDGHRRAVTQGWRGANPGLCYTTPLGLELPAAFQPILSLMDKALAKPGIPERHRGRGRSKRVRLISTGTVWRGLMRVLRGVVGPAKVVNGRHGASWRIRLFYKGVQAFWRLSDLAERYGLPGLRALRRLQLGPRTVALGSRLAGLASL